MKKYIGMILILVVAFCAIGAPSVYAAGASAGTFYLSQIQMGDTTTMIYNLSKNVNMEFGKFTSGTTAAAYAICTYHSSGDRAIGTGSVDQKVFFYEVNSFAANWTQTQCSAPSDNTTSMFNNQAGWSAL